MASQSSDVWIKKLQQQEGIHNKKIEEWNDATQFLIILLRKVSIKFNSANGFEWN